MVIEKTVEKALSNLIRNEETEVLVGESLITLRVFDHATKIVFSTRVYRGENYIPPSVRQCLSIVFPELPVQTYLTIDEKSFSVFLHFIGGTESLNHLMLKSMLEDFAAAADVWRDLLDEHDQRDLIHVRVK